MKKIKAFPDIDIRNWGRKPSSDSILQSENFHFYSSGRAAVYFMARAISGGQRKTAYLPVFHCGVEVEAFLRAGFEVKFYNINENFDVDFGSSSKCEFMPGDVFFIIHYFGFPQNMDKITAFCRDRQLILVEDCAHGLYSRCGGRLLGTFGEWAVFSMRKTLALPNGGGLLRRDTSLPCPESGKRVFNPLVIKSGIRSVLEFEINTGSFWGICAKFLVDAYSWCFPSTSECSSDTSDKKQSSSVDVIPTFYDDTRFAYDLDIGRVSQFLLHPMPFADIVSLRRKNYQSLGKRLSQLKNIKPMFPELEEGVCPLCYPVWVSSSDWWVDQLKKRGVEAFVFGRHHHRILGESDAKRMEKMRTCILGLPVHQMLSEKEIEELVERIGDTLP